MLRRSDESLMSDTASTGLDEVRPAHAFNEDRVTAWLEAHVAGFKGPMQVQQFSGGQSNPTFLLTTARGAYVLRRKPAGPTLKTAHAVDREYRITSALHAQGIPVARPLAFCDDPEVMPTPFFVMEHVTGRIFWSPALPELAPAGRRATYHALADTLARLHAVSIDDAGLADFGKRGNYFARQIARWSEQYRASRVQPLAAMDDLMAWLAVRSPVPSGREAVIHGDYRLDNVIFDAATPTVRALIDWELSTLGDPLADLSYQCMLWHLPAGVFGSLGSVDLDSSGIPTESEYLDLYFARAGGTRPADWDALIVYNLFRLAAILEGVGRRALDGNASSRRATEMAQLVEPIATTAWALARRS
ncbi:MAG: phosphotransferase [Cytophagaceae bacterium]|nr:phosphotransferase [Gemmatimonadaceae bacterium]